LPLLLEPLETRLVPRVRGVGDLHVGEGGRRRRCRLRERRLRGGRVELLESVARVVARKTGRDERSRRLADLLDVVDVRVAVEGLRDRDADVLVVERSLAVVEADVVAAAVRAVHDLLLE